MSEPASPEQDEFMNVDAVEMQRTFARLKETFKARKTRTLDYRRNQLRALSKLLEENKATLGAALEKDLSKGTYESWTSEIGFTIGEIKHTIKSLKKWSKVRRVNSPVVTQPAKSFLMPEPLGVVLIIGAWNYPVQLTLGPLVAAIAAGNCAIVKPSELSGATSKLLAELFPKYLDVDAFKVIEGAAEETTELLKLPFDHIFYTGGETVAKIVMRAAAENLIPVTLELGGKSPCVVAPDCNWNVAPARIAWSKFMNAGQTCVAPDYIIVQKQDAQKLIDGLQAQITQFYGEDPKQSKDFGRIINQRHAKRLAGYLEGVNCVIGGEVDLDNRYIAPTVVLNPAQNSALMTEEIFGPILPVVTVDDIDHSIELINGRAKPLAMYVYTENKAFADKLLGSTSAGSVAINDGFMFMANPNLPFGGVGNSGMGRYHGRFGFDTLSHTKSVIDRSTKLDPSLRYPPYGKLKLSLIKRLI